MSVCCYNRCHGHTVKGFGVLWDNIYERLCCYNRFHSDDVKAFCYLLDNIYNQ
jgi:hypothetical protein